MTFMKGSKKRKFSFFKENEKSEYKVFAKLGSKQQSLDSNFPLHNIMKQLAKCSTSHDCLMFNVEFSLYERSKNS
ncbi:CLUMA_CG019878, isoform A [Clunio marinus]|uniref:CLUMA_CG019878, isoform A n=1 Tax=Clunio marinus TaxID=568069 RepID=A0A1J1J435_9DIPT|nr:CLUMA_CG019878, isoform A [Clunio marinus]